MTTLKLGRIVATPGALETLSDANVGAATLLSRHASGDWGDICKDDAKLNDAAAKGEDRILSAYDLPNGGKVWIITEWDRSATTLLLPEEY